MMKNKSLFRELHEKKQIHSGYLTVAFILILIFCVATISFADTVVSDHKIVDDGGSEYPIYRDIRTSPQDAIKKIDDLPDIFARKIYHRFPKGQYENILVVANKEIATEEPVKLFFGNYHPYLKEIKYIFRENGYEFDIERNFKNNGYKLEDDNQSIKKFKTLNRDFDYILTFRTEHYTLDNNKLLSFVFVKLLELPKLDVMWLDYYLYQNRTDISYKLVRKEPTHQTIYSLTADIVRFIKTNVNSAASICVANFENDKKKIFKNELDSYLENSNIKIKGTKEADFILRGKIFNEDKKKKLTVFLENRTEEYKTAGKTWTMDKYIAKLFQKKADVKLFKFLNNRIYFFLFILGLVILFIWVTLSAKKHGLF